MFILKPQLERAYTIKENFYFFLESDNRATAAIRLDAWLDDV